MAKIKQSIVPCNDSDLNVLSACGLPALVNKAVGAIHIKNDISCLQRKLWAVLLSNAYEELPRPDIPLHSIPVRDLMDAVGFDSKNIGYLRQALEDMVTTKLTWNILDQRGKHEWGVSAALASAVLAEGMCVYSYSAHLRLKLYNPEFYAPLPLGILRRFASGHALALYENCVRYLGVRQTPMFNLEVFRDLLGVGNSDSYDDFKILNRAVVKPAVEEVNKISDVELTVELKREKRKVVGIKFLVDLSRQAALPITPPDNFDKQLLESLKEIFCLSERQSKEILVTHSVDRIRSVMDYVEARYRDGKVKAGKIAPYFLKTIKDFDEAAVVSSIDRERKRALEQQAQAAQKEKDSAELRAKFVAFRNESAKTYFQSLDESARKLLLENFGPYLATRNMFASQAFKRSGIRATIVVTELNQYILEKYLPHLTFEEYSSRSS